MITHITLIIAHKQHLFRAILQNILQSGTGICVLAKVNTAEKLLEKINDLQPDVVLAGLELEGMGDAGAWQKLLSKCGKTKVIISWRHHDAGKIPDMMRTQGVGYIAWDASPAEYIFAVKQAVKGGQSFCNQTQKLRESSGEAASFVEKPDDTLLKILYCIYMGYSNKEIAIATRLKESTVKSYRKKLKSIIGFRSVAGLKKLINE